MPVQKHDPRSVERPSGLVPPDVALDGVTELRLHGVGGTTPENLLADAAPQKVAGDRVAGFYRTADRDGHHVEAYSWGGLTSRSGVRVLWLLLLPFTLVNLAGWMCTPKTWQRPWRFHLHRATVRWAALGLTVNLLLLVAMMTMDIIAYQCATAPACVDHWWLGWLNAGILTEHPGNRVLVGAAAPLLVAIGLWALSRRSLARYERVAPPRHVDDTAVTDVTPARPNTGLDDRDFWNSAASVAHLAWLHLSMTIAFLSWLTTHVVRSILRQAGIPVSAQPLATAVTWTAAAAALGTLVLATRTRTRGPAVAAVVAVGLLALSAAVVFTVVQPAVPAAVAGPGSLPGMKEAARWTVTCCLAAALSVLLSAAVNGHRRGTFRFAAPFVLTVLAAMLLNAVGIGMIIRAADLLATVANPGRVCGADALCPYETAYALTPYLILLPVLITTCFVLAGSASLWHSARPERQQVVRAEYADLDRPDPPSAWDVCALDDVRTPGRAGALSRPGTLLTRVLRRGWTARVARGRWLATLPHGTDLLLSTIALAMVAVVVYCVVVVWGLDTLPYAPRWALTVSTWLAALAPLLVLLLMRRGWRGLRNRRHLGVLWDVGTFWPRAYHPLAPPSYTERAVPELQRRLWYIHDHAGAAVIAAHSQGTVLAVAALMQETSRPHTGGRPTDQVGLVTFGSPLTTLYGWAFPAYFGHPSGDPRPRVWRWRNFHYDTDYIGGPVHPGDDPAPVDERLSDPPTAWYVHGQPPPSLGRHSGYWTDPRVWRVVDRYAADLPPPCPPSPPG